jgi:hypothetical protein
VASLEQVVLALIAEGAGFGPALDNEVVRLLEPLGLDRLVELCEPREGMDAIDVATPRDPAGRGHTGGMPKISVHLPDNLHRRAQEQQLPLSRLTQEAIRSGPISIGIQASSRNSSVGMKVSSRPASPSVSRRMITTPPTRAIHSS